MITCACRPVSRRTPVASYITMDASVKLTANSAVSNPHTAPTITVSDTTNAVWEEGMPPAPRMRRQSSFFSTSQ